MSNPIPPRISHTPLIYTRAGFSGRKLGTIFTKPSVAMKWPTPMPINPSPVRVRNTLNQPFLFSSFRKNLSLSKLNNNQHNQPQVNAVKPERPQAFGLEITHQIADAQ